VAAVEQEDEPTARPGRGDSGVEPATGIVRHGAWASSARHICRSRSAARCADEWCRTPVHARGTLKRGRRPSIVSRRVVLRGSAIGARIGVRCAQHPHGLVAREHHLRRPSVGNGDDAAPRRLRIHHDNAIFF
jgi:hypothetical protein